MNRVSVFFGVRIWVLCLLWLGQGGYVSAQPSEFHLTLSEAIKIALEDNPAIHVADQEIALKKVSYKEAWQSLLPTVDLTGSVSYTVKAATMSLNGNNFKMGRDATSTWNGILSVNLPVYAPAVYRTMKLGRMDIELAGEKSRESRLDMINQVTKAYFQLLLSQDSYDVLKGSYAYSEKNYEMVNAKYQAGSVSEYDKISAEVQMRNLRPSLVAAENAVRLAEVQLKVLLGISDAELGLVVDDSLKAYEHCVKLVESPENKGLLQNSVMRQYDLNEKILAQTLKVQKTNFFPTLSMNYQFQDQSLFNDDFRFWHYDWAPSSTIALTLSVPLYRASNFTKLQSIRIQMQQLGENRINTERQLNMQVQSCLDNMTASVEQMGSNKESVAQAEKGRMIAEKRYNVGKGTMLELNNSEIVLTQALLAYNQAIYDFLVARADLKYLYGEEK